MSKFTKFFGLSVLTVTLATLVWCVAGFAQLNTAKIEGTVRDQDTGQPLQGAQVVVEGTRLGNVTNADGYYFILNVPPGRKSITFTYTGYQQTTIGDQLILAGHTATVNAALSSTIVELGGITVEGEAEVLMPRDQTVSKRRMTAESIAETPATTLEDMMVLEAGVQTGGEGALSRGLRIRGSRLGKEAMVVDGVIVRNYTANPFRSGIQWVYEQEEGSLGEDTTPLEFSTGSVEEVDILTGGFQAEYGNASGIINIVTKEGSPDWKGNVRFVTDQQNPRTADYGYNQLMTSIGGPIPGIRNLYIHASGEIQGRADRQPTHGDEGFHGINQEFVDRLNHAVRNDIVLGRMQPVFTLEEFQTAREAWAAKTGQSAALFSPPNPVRVPGNWGDRTLASGKITYFPIQRLKFLSSISFSRNQHSYPNNDDGNYWPDGWATTTTMPTRNWAGDAPDTSVFISMAFARRTRTTNLLLGFNWDFLQSAQRSGALQFRYTRFRTQDISSSNPVENYFRSEKTFMGWSPHDVLFMVETFPHEEVDFVQKVGDETITYKKSVINFPATGTEEALIHFPDGLGHWMRNFPFMNPFRMYTGESLYWLVYRYLKEEQHNFKADVDFQLDRWNRAKVGMQYTAFDNNMFQLSGSLPRRDVGNEFDYGPKMYAFYMQNRTDLGDFVFDYGIRYDRFDPAPDPLDNWGYRSGDQWLERFIPVVMSDWSPRFDVGFPVTDKTQLRFSYGVFNQLPSMSFIFSGSNPGGLEFSRTDMFEAGLSYLLTNDMVLDLVAFYRDITGDVASKEFFRDYTQWHSGLRIRGWTEGYTNQDHGNTKGVDFTVRRRFSNNFAYNLMYSLQFARTTGSRYNTSEGWEHFIDPTTGEEFTPPDEIRPAEADVTHKMTANFNYLFPDDFQAGTIYNTILKNVRAYAVFNLLSGAPANLRLSGYDARVTYQSAAEDMSYITYRGGRPVGGINYFRGRWSYALDLRLTKSFYIGRARRLSIYTEILNALNNKLPTPYPSGYTYESYFGGPMGGVEVEWSEGLSDIRKAWFQSDFNGDGVLSLMEQAKANIANSFMNGTMNKSAWGIARQIYLGVEFGF